PSPRWSRCSACSSCCRSPWSEDDREICAPIDRGEIAVPKRACRLRLEELTPCDLGDRDHAGMGDPSLHRNREELLDQLGGSTHHLHPVLSACFCLEDRRRHEDAPALAAKRLHQGRVVELTDQA